jgi:tetratricopeptide (TPR) repeat protein
MGTARSFVQLVLVAVTIVGNQGAALCEDADFGKRIADAQARFDAGDFSQAQHQLSSILTDIEKDPRHKDQEWEAAYSLGETDLQLGAFEQAHVALTKALSIAQKNSSPDKTELARSWLGLAQLQQLQYKWPEAADLRKKASEAALHSKDAAMIQAQILDGDAQTAIQAGQYEKAQSLWKEALAIREKRLKSNDPALIYLIRNYAVALRGIGAKPVAEQLEVKASQLERQTTGQAMPQQIEAINCLAVADVKRDQMQAAEDGFKKVLDLAQKNLPPNHPLIGEALTNLGTLYAEERKFKDADPLLKRALSVQSKTYGPTNWKLETVLNDLGVMNLQWGNSDVAEAYLKRSLHLREQTFGGKSRFVAEELKNLGALYCSQSKWDEAKTNLLRAKEIYEQAKDTSAEDLSGCYQNFAVMYAGQRKYPDAEAAIRKALAFGEKAYGPDSAHTAVLLNALGTVLVSEGKYADAEPVYKRSFNIIEKQGKPKDPNFSAALQSYTFILRKLNRTSEASALENQFSH